jgi:hypothetical protein
VASPKLLDEKLMEQQEMLDGEPLRTEIFLREWLDDQELRDIKEPRGEEETMDEQGRLEATKLLDEKKRQRRGVAAACEEEAHLRRQGGSQAR